MTKLSRTVVPLSLLFLMHVAIKNSVHVNFHYNLSIENFSISTLARRTIAHPIKNYTRTLSFTKINVKEIPGEIWPGQNHHTKGYQVNCMVNVSNYPAHIHAYKSEVSAMTLS